MKKGQTIGLNSRVGKSGEKYIYFHQRVGLFVVMVPTKSIPKQKHLGYFKTLKQAIIRRNEYLESLTSN